MNIVIFYEKPGCTTNKKQKKLLRDAGYTLIERNVLAHGLSKDELYSFFQHKPIEAWFNPNAPQIKTGMINIKNLSKKEAINLLFMEPILIKRPLMLIDNQRISGFEQLNIENILNVSFGSAVSNTCSAHDKNCSAHRRSAS